MKKKNATAGTAANGFRHNGVWSVDQDYHFVAVTSVLGPGLLGPSSEEIPSVVMV
jgi:hypothetical protein